MPDIDGLDKPWTRQAGESDKAFHAFTHLLSLVPYERSMDRAYTVHQKACKHSQNPKPLLSCDPAWYDWRFKHSWLERCAAHDAVRYEQDRLRRLAEIDAMNLRHQQLAIALQNTVVKRLQALSPTEILAMSPVQMANVLDRASTIERRSRDVATTITKTEGAGGGVVLDLSKLSDAELSVFSDLVARCQPVASKAEVE